MLRLDNPAIKTAYDYTKKIYVESNNSIYLTYNRYHLYPSIRMSRTAAKVNEIVEPSLSEIVEKIGASSPEIKIEDDHHLCYKIPRESCKNFLNAIKKLQLSKFIFPLSSLSFKGILNELRENSVISFEESTEYSSTIKTSIPFYEYEENTLKEKNIESILALAYFYRDKNDDENFYPKKEKIVQCLKNIKKINEISSKENLAKLVDINDFIWSFKSSIDENMLNIIDIFGADNVRASLVRYKDICFDDETYEIETYEKIGRLLQKTDSIEKLNFNVEFLLNAFVVHQTKPLTSKTVIPIANGLRKNSSVTELNLEKRKILDEGLCAILLAIKDNPNSSLTELNLNNCGITDAGATELRDFIFIRRHIVYLNISFNKISPSIIKALEIGLDYNRSFLANKTREILLNLKVDKNLINIVLEYLSLSKIKDVKENLEPITDLGLIFNSSE